MTKKILIVEDQEDNRQIMSDLLENAGYDVTLATNGQEGVLLAKSLQPDLILMDIQLPKMDGIQATRSIKSEASLRDVPIIAVTSFVLSNDRDEAEEAGCDDYVAKPVSPRDLLVKVNSYLRR